MSRYVTFSDERREWMVIDMGHVPPRVMCRCFGAYASKYAEYVRNALEMYKVEFEHLFVPSQEIQDAVAKELEDGND